MNSQQVKEFLDYIQANNSWECMIKGQLCGVKKRIIKYIRMNIDTRDGIMFSITITFDNIINNKGKEESFRIENEEDLKKLYEWLEEEVK